jgi:hypothetical protein
MTKKLSVSDRMFRLVQRWHTKSRQALAGLRVTVGDESAGEAMRSNGSHVVITSLGGECGHL